MNWWHAKGGEQVGPFSEDDFRQLIANGTIASDTLVWHEGMSEWAPLGKTPDAPPPAAGAASAPAAYQASGDAPGTSTCVECRRAFATDDMIAYENVYVCAGCKPVFFQRIQEGADAPISGGTGETPNAELMERARNRLSGKWGITIGTCMAFWGISFAIAIAGSLVGSVIPFAGNVAQLLLMPPLELGLAVFFITLVRSQTADIGLLFGGFNRYGASIGVYFFRSLIVGAWSLLAMLPGIIMMIVAGATDNEELIPFAVILFTPGIVVSVIVSYMYMWPMYILADTPGIGIFDAIKQSRLMMRGMKWKLFCLNLRFFGWTLLCMLTLFIGFIWLGPYIAASFAAFYEDTRGRASLAA